MFILNMGFLVGSALGSVTAAAAPTEAPAEPAKTIADPAGPTVPRRPRARGKRATQVWYVAAQELRHEPLVRPSGNLRLERLAGGDQLSVNIYNPDGSYNADAVEAATHILRCKRTNSERPIDPRLLVVLSHVYDHFGGRAIEIVSGFRNQRRTSSFHYKGSASDIRVPGVKPAEVRAFVETLDEGGMGIGLYPRSQFVHVDVRPLPSCRWIDWSPPNPDAPDKQPPRGWRRRHLQS